MIKIPFLNQSSGPTIRPVVLLVLDGWGSAPPSAGNAISQARTPNMDNLMRNYPSGEIIASGEAVGLPAGEVGNTEVGHLNLGAGRVIYQSFKRINMAIEDGSFFDNPALLSALTNAEQNGKRLHIAGLVSSGNVHSSLEHLMALIKMVKLKGMGQYTYYHLFTDGRDSNPKDGINIIQNIQKRLMAESAGTIASISGRYYAMDRDMRWERTKKAYDALVHGIGRQATDPAQAIKSSYQESKTDEFVEPTVIMREGRPVATLAEGDSVIIYNFRIDRPRQITMALTLPDFERLRSFKLGYDPTVEKDMGEVPMQTFNRGQHPKSLFVVTMTEYQKGLPVSEVAFPPGVIEASLAQVISNAGLKQLHLAESEKERFVTIYFDGLRDAPLPREDKIIVPSPKVPTYDQKPEMSVYKLEEEFEKAVKKGGYHFYVMNFANADMVAHSGNLGAAMRAVEHVDAALGRVVNAVLASGGALLVTADHGNAEEMLTFPKNSFFYTSKEGEMNTDHSANPVPAVIVRQDFANSHHSLPRGELADIAPTVLALMGLKKPPQMTGKNLLGWKT